MERVFRMERSGRDGERLRDANLYLGNHGDADAFPGQRLCVLEAPHCRGSVERTVHMPILIDGVAKRDRLNEAADYITSTLQGGQDLIVHCAAGEERSPLAVAWWFIRVGAYPTLDAAYAAIASVRPVVQDRRAWLEPVS